MHQDVARGEDLSDNHFYFACFCEEVVLPLILAKFKYPEIHRKNK